MTQVLEPSALRRAVVAALAALRARAAVINDANVYPVHDSDTGTNMVATLGAVAAVDPERWIQVAAAEARGNSGVILAQWLRGFLDPSNPDILAALKRASQVADEAMAEPREGTILTVARAAADAALPDRPFTSAATAAQEALVRTQEQNPALRAAGVVDAGGLGLWVILDAFAGALEDGHAFQMPQVATHPIGEPEEQGLAYEVQFHIEVASTDGLRGSLSKIADSIAITGGDGVWTVHAHTDDPAAVTAIASEVGEPRDVSVTRLSGVPGLRVHAMSSQVFAPVRGDGWRALFAELGAVVDPPAPKGAIVVSKDGTVPVCDEGEAFAALLVFSPSRSLEENIISMRQAVDRCSTLGFDHVDSTLSTALEKADEVPIIFLGAGIDVSERETLERAGLEVRDGGQASPRFLVVVE